MTDVEKLLGSPNETEVYSALIKLGKAGEREHERAVARFLEHASAKLRGAAIRVLGFYWRLPGYRDRAERMTREETDAQTRSSAIMAWCAYTAGTKDPRVLRELYAIFHDTAASTQVRQAAYLGMMEVVGLSRAEQAKAVPSGPFDASIDWDLVRRLLDGTGIELPTQSTSIVATLGVRKVWHDYGEPNAPRDPMGRIVLTFNGEIGMVELVQQRGTKLRGWRAGLPTETWNNLVETLHRYSFPKPATLLEPPVPGSVSKTIGWERRGQQESVRITGRSTDYSDINRIVWNVVAQMAPELLDATPPAFPNTRVDTPLELKDVEMPY